MPLTASVASFFSPITSLPFSSSGNAKVLAPWCKKHGMLYTAPSLSVKIYGFDGCHVILNLRRKTRWILPQSWQLRAPPLMALIWTLLWATLPWDLKSNDSNAPGLSSNGNNVEWDHAVCRIIPTNTGSISWMEDLPRPVTIMLA